MILTYIAGILTPFALYGIYKAYQKFIRPNDIKATLDRLEVETEKIKRTAIKEACKPEREN